MGQLLRERWIKPNMKKIKTQEEASGATIINKPVVAKASAVRHSPRKMRLVADAVRGMNPQKAIEQLTLLPHAAAKTLLKAYKQAVGNATNNFKLSPADLVVTKLMIEEGPRGPKRADVHSHGARFTRGVRRKRMAHIVIEVAARN